MISTPLPPIHQGDDYDAIANVTHMGEAVDLSPYTATAQLRRSSADVDASVDATFSCVISGTTVILSLPRSVTTTLTGAYVYDLQLTEIATGKLRTIARGPAPITAEVTR